MSEYIERNDQKRQSLSYALEHPLPDTFNLEAEKDRPHPNAEYKNQTSGPLLGGGRYRQKRKGRHAQASKPFSIRLTPAERERLREDAAGESSGSYVKKVLFAPTTKAAARRKMIDHHKKLIGQVLAMVGSSGVADALTTMALAIQSGTFEDEAEIKTTLTKAESELSEIRKALLKAFGMRKT